MRLTVVCGCAGADLGGAAAAASRDTAVLLDFDRAARAWIGAAIRQLARDVGYFRGWALRADRLEDHLRGQALVPDDSRDFDGLDRHARPITDAVTDCVARLALEELRTRDVVIRGHVSRDDRHAIIAAFENAHAPVVQPATQRIAAKTASIAAMLSRLADSAYARAVAGWDADALVASTAQLASLTAAAVERAEAAYDPDTDLSQAESAVGSYHDAAVALVADAASASAGFGQLEWTVDTLRNAAVAARSIVRGVDPRLRGARLGAARDEATALLGPTTQDGGAARGKRRKPRAAELMFVEVPPPGPCPPAYESLVHETPHRRSTKSLLDGKHRYVVVGGEHDLDSQAAADAFSEQAASRPRELDVSAKVWEHVRAQLSGGPGASDGHGRGRGRGPWY